MKKYLFVITVILFWVPSLITAQSIATTPHNLSSASGNTIKADVETQLCIFCHAVHHAGPQKPAPLWNRADPGLGYTLYSSTTLNALPGQPDGSSLMCLSCHDGTIALGAVLSRAPAVISFTPAFMSGTGLLGKDLRNDHPISFVYDNALAVADGQLLMPGLIVPPVSLEATKVQCSSCHDVHDNLTSDFLVASIQFSAICNSCHNKTYWGPTSSHNTSVKIWNGTPPDPWPTSPYTTVGENDCTNCHWSHNGGFPRLTKYQAEEDNCLDCHNGNLTGAPQTPNVAAQFAKASIHNVYGYTGIHDPTEATYAAPMHVECIDCHNPHAVTTKGVAVAPNANGFLAGVKGITQAGGNIDPVQYEYEVCYRCHADVAATASPTTRQYGANNVRLDFATGNHSHHAVVGSLNNPDVGSLIAPLVNGSVIYCTDCHASDGVGSPEGPHGSIYPQILVRYYNRGDNLGIQNNVSAMTANFPLCVTVCHDAAAVRSKHIGMKQAHIFKKTSCNTCHDPHGFNGGNINNNNFLINFNTNIISANGNGDMFVNILGGNTGTCELTCHGHDHAGASY